MKLTLREMRIRHAVEAAVQGVWTSHHGEPEAFGPLLGKMLAAGIIAARRADGIVPTQESPQEATDASGG